MAMPELAPNSDVYGTLAADSFSDSPPSPSASVSETERGRRTQVLRRIYYHAPG
jgi:hypothetical protein